MRSFRVVGEIRPIRLDKTTGRPTSVLYNTVDPAASAAACSAGADISEENSRHGQVASEDRGCGVGCERGVPFPAD